MENLIIADLVSLKQGVSPEEGTPIYEKIYNAVSNGQPIMVDFADMELVTTAFLNVAIGTLYKDFTSEALNPLVKFGNVTPEIASRIKRVTTNAKAFYANPEQFELNVDKALYGND